MPPTLSTAPCAAKPRGTAAWLVVTSLLLSLLCLAHFAGPVPVQAQATHCPAPPDSALIMPTVWHQ